MPPEIRSCLTIVGVVVVEFCHELLHHDGHFSKVPELLKEALHEQARLNSQVCFLRVEVSAVLV